jgi:hypothetical protein
MTRRNVAAVVIWAGLCNLTAILAALLVFSADGQPAALLLLPLAAAVTLAPLVAAVGMMIPAMAGEKSDGTLQALMLTPVSRRELLWAKLLGRMRPVRRMMFWCLPANFCCLAVTGHLVWEVPADCGAFHLLTYALLLATVSTTLAVLWAALTVLQAHAIGAMTLYCSARASGPLSAQVWSLVVVFVPTVVLGCCGYGLPAIVYHMIAGPVMFTELVRNLDRFVLGDE